jgi:hypothetical protein
MLFFITNYDLVNNLGTHACKTIQNMMQCLKKDYINTTETLSSFHQYLTKHSESYTINYNCNNIVCFFFFFLKKIRS